jgi:hypothetical protein
LEEIKVGAFEGLSQLKILDLSSNNLRQLGKGVFDPLGQLLGLDISDNQLVDLPHDLFSNLKNLEILYLNNNNQLQGKSLLAFKGLKRLKQLSVENTHISDRLDLLGVAVGRSCKINNRDQATVYYNFFSSLVLHSLICLCLFLPFLLYEWYWPKNLPWLVIRDMFCHVFALTVALEYIVLGVEEFCILITFYPRFKFFILSILLIFYPQA